MCTFKTNMELEDDDLAVQTLVWHGPFLCFIYEFKTTLHI
jgi:hypothetical protein